MKYFVVMPDGQKFGPADVDVLTQWANEGRINQSTMLEDAGTSQRLTAGSVPGILFPMATMDTPAPQAPYSAPMGGYNPPQQSPYQRGPVYTNPAGVSAGQNEVMWSWICFALSIACVGCLGSIPGIYLGKKAMDLGNRGGKAPYIANIITLVLSVIAVGFWFFLIFIGGAARTLN